MTQAADAWSAQEHEKAFVQVFCEKVRQDRYLELLHRQKTRPKFMRLLYHDIEIREHHKEIIADVSQTVDGIESELRKRGAGALCYCMSTNSEYDGKFLPLRDALDSLTGLGDGTILSFIPGKLCYYEGEEPNCGYILFPGKRLTKE